MRLQHLVEFAQSNVWAIDPKTLHTMRVLLHEAVQGRRLLGGELHAEVGIPMPQERDTATKVASAKQVRVAVLPIYGTIMPHSASMGTSTRDVESRLAAAVGAKDVDAILLDIDSPGGVVTGVPELAEQIAAARRVKPMLAYNGGMMASAAYWLGAAAGEVMATTSALTGSIGVYTWHEDLSGKLEKDGVKVTEISAGAYKTESAPWKPLTEEGLAHEQAQVDEFYGMFVKSVADNRRDTQQAVREGYGQGRVETSPQARQANLIDRVGSFDAALSRLVSRVQSAKARDRRAAMIRDLELKGIAYCRLGIRRTPATNFATVWSSVS